MTQAAPGFAAAASGGCAAARTWQPVAGLLPAEGALPAPQSAAQFAAVIAADIPRWQKLARQQSITLEQA